VVDRALLGCSEHIGGLGWSSSRYSTVGAVRKDYSRQGKRNWKCEETIYRLRSIPGVG
jgi:hypothetical protein